MTRLPGGAHTADPDVRPPITSVPPGTIGAGRPARGRLSRVVWHNCVVVETPDPHNHANRPVAVVTGGTSGIGRALARRLSGDGYRVVVVGRDRGRLDEVGRELSAETHAVDVGDADAVTRLCADLVERHPRIDVLVCNAGMPGRGSAPRTSPELARRVMAVNFHGTADVTVGLWDALVAARGWVVNIVSVAGTVATAYSAAYTASKHAALAWSRALAVSAAGTGVRVLTVNPGPVVTPGFPQTELVGRRLAGRAVIHVDRCADEVMRAMARGRAEVFVPRWWRAASVVQATAPGVARRIMTRMSRGRGVA